MNSTNEITHILNDPRRGCRAEELLLLVHAELRALATPSRRRS